MNFVKGVADLIRRTSAGQSGDFSSGLKWERLSPPSPIIRFSEVGDEAILKTLWERYDSSFDKVEKRKLFNVFLKQFLIVYQTWEPPNVGQPPDDAFSASPVEYSEHLSDVVIGCSIGHPPEIIHVLVEEVTQITAMVTEFVQSSTDKLGSRTTAITYEGLPVLDALAVITRSMHNCRVFGFYNGVQKLTALMKAAVVQLKTISSALSGDESLPTCLVDKSVILQKLLAHVVLVLCSFIDLHTGQYEKTQLNNSSWVLNKPMTDATSTQPSVGGKAPHSESLLRWRHRAIVAVMEAGGLNWLVELLRVLRRLIMKEQWTDLSLQCLTLRTLQLSLADNPRGQNHFRSIGGLEVLLDGLGVSSNNAIRPDSSSFTGTVRTKNPLQAIFHLHILSLEVLREAV